MNRAQHLAALRHLPEISVLIVGGGINGIGAFRDLALQGVDVLLIDKGDFCSGASAASSHMIHGGLRYLENGEFRLVREAVHERNTLIRNAPHYVKRLPTTIPIFSWFSGLLNAPLKFFGRLYKPAERGAVVIKLGLLLYDAFTGPRRAVPKHSFQLRSSSLSQFPSLNSEITCTATYFDGAMVFPERICIELILDAEAVSTSAHALNYMKMTAGAGKSVTMVDELTGEEFSVRPKIIINAAGPWIDQANRALDHHSHMIGGTKGSHLVLRHPELREAIGGHEFFFENDDGRIVLIFPLGNRVLVGTSDIRIDDPDQARCTEEEVDYFIDMVARVFPEIKIDRSHIVFRFSGVRPLPFGSETVTGQISRDHRIEMVEPRDNSQVPVYCLVGGKWTTFRAFSQEITDIVLTHLGKKREVDTENLPFGGGVGYPQSAMQRKSWLHSINLKTGHPMDRLEILFNRYGTRAVEFVDHFVENGDKTLKHHWSFSQQEIDYLAKREKILHLEDLVLRRTNLAKLGELTTALLEELAAALAPRLDWPQRVCQEEVERTVRVLEDKHGVRL